MVGMAGERGEHHTPLPNLPPRLDNYDPALAESYFGMDRLGGQ